jgi:hypothetical protein
MIGASVAQPHLIANAHDDQIATSCSATRDYPLGGSPARWASPTRANLAYDHRATMQLARWPANVCNMVWGHTPVADEHSSASTGRLSGASQSALKSSATIIGRSIAIKQLLEEESELEAPEPRDALRPDPLP